MLIEIWIVSKWVSGLTCLSVPERPFKFKFPLWKHSLSIPFKPAALLGLRSQSGNCTREMHLECNRSVLLYWSGASNLTPRRAAGCWRSVNPRLHAASWENRWSAQSPCCVTGGCPAALRLCQRAVYHTCVNNTFVVKHHIKEKM